MKKLIIPLLMLLFIALTAFDYTKQCQIKIGMSKKQVEKLCKDSGYYLKQVFEEDSEVNYYELEGKNLLFGKYEVEKFKMAYKRNKIYSFMPIFKNKSDVKELYEQLRKEYIAKDNSEGSIYFIFKNYFYAINLYEERIMLISSK